MTAKCRECYYWIETPAGDDGCRLLIDRPEIGVCVARLTARIRELETREAKPDLTPGLERARDLLIDRPEIGVCVARLTARVRELEEREAKPDLTPGLERAREVLRELARGWADATADHLMDALREDAGPRREVAARKTEECAIRRSALLSAADRIGEVSEDAGK